MENKLEDEVSKLSKEYTSHFQQHKDVYYAAGTGLASAIIFKGIIVPFALGFGAYYAGKWMYNKFK